MQSFHSDGGVSSTLTTALAAMIKNTPGFGQRAFVALGDQQNVHALAVFWASWPTLIGTALSVSIMKLSESLRARLSMLA